MLDKRYDHHLVEKDKYESWKEKGYFASGDKSKDPFSIVIPPPNVTGKLHLGHEAMMFYGFQAWITLVLPLKQKSWKSSEIWV